MNRRNFLAFAMVPFLARFKKKSKIIYKIPDSFFLTPIPPRIEYIGKTSEQIIKHILAIYGVSA